MFHRLSEMYSGIGTVNNTVKETGNNTSKGTSKGTFNNTVNNTVNDTLEKEIDEKSKKLLDRFTIYSNHNPINLSFTNSFGPNHYIDDADVKIYNRVTNRVTNTVKHISNKNTIDVVLKDPVNINNVQLPLHITRELYLQSKKEYDFCLELSDNPPFNIRCLQNLFIKVGGLETGYSFPSANTISIYNSMGTLGAIQQYFNDLVQNTKSSNDNIKRDAMLKLLGTTENRARVPYIQGIEVFWFSGVFLGRTIEKDFIKDFKDNTVIQITDIRTPFDFSVKFEVNVDNGFFISVNKPSDINVLNDRIIDDPGLFANMEGKGTYVATSYSRFTSHLPNVTKIFSNRIDCNIKMDPQYYSLTCEHHAPFLNFEVNHTFRETRNPGIFSKFIEVTGLTYHTRTEERHVVPGNKSFARLNGANSSIYISNISNQCWGSITFAMRLQTMPILETIIHIGCNIILKPINGSTAGMYIQHNQKWITTPYKLSLNKWYLIYATNYDEFNINCVGINDKIGSHTTIYKNRLNPLSIIIGTQKCNIVKASSFVYDIAWIHFFDYVITDDDIYRECNADWIYTL